MVHGVNAAGEGTFSADRTFRQGLDITFPGTENFAVGDHVTLSRPDLIMALGTEFLIRGKGLQSGQQEQNRTETAEK
jgi:hypothetical protein